MLAQSQSIFYVHKASMMADHCTQHEQNPLIHLIYHYKHTNFENVWNNGYKCYILAQSQGTCYMHQVHIVVDYCTKYEQNKPFFSEILQQTHEMVRKI